jgi:parallel beta-helix repeat protein
MLAFGAIASAAEGRRYFVDATSGNDSNSGLTSAVPWKTLSKVNGATFAAGNKVLFKRGETWREQLTVPSSGSAGNPITFGAYGSGGSPEFRGSRSVDAGDWSTVYEETEHGPFGPSQNADDKSVNFANNSTVDSVDVGIGVGNAGYIGSAGIRFNSVDIDHGASVSSAWVVLNAKFGSSTGFAVSVSGHASTNSATFGNYADMTGRARTAASVPWEVVGWQVDTDIESPNVADVVNEITSLPGWSSGGSITLFFDAELSPVVRRGQAKAYNNGSGFPQLYYSTYTDVAIANVYRAPVDVAPNVVLFDGVVGSQKFSRSGLESNRDWYTDGAYVYIYATSLTNIEVCERYAGVYIDAKENIVINDIASINHNVNAFFAGAYKNVVFKRCVGTVSHRGGFQLLGDSPPPSGGNCTGGVIRHCEMTYAGQNSSPGNGVSLGIDFSGSYCVGTLVEYNSVHHCYQGIEPDQLSSYGIIRYNEIHNNTSIGIQIDNTDYNQVYGNIVYNNGVNVDPDAYGCMIWVEGGININVGNQIFNNVFYNNSGGGILIQNKNEALEVKNNIFLRNYEQSIFEINLASNFEDISGCDIDYNCYYRPSGDYFVTASSTQRNFTDWKSTTGFDAHSVNSDPLFTDIANSDFTLQAGSPCINAGTDVGLTTDYAGNPIVGNPDIGAFEYQP